jgi:hypothetical protein
MLFLLAARRALGLDGPEFASVYQGSVRSNTYVALATVPALYGEGGLALLALLIAAVVPLVNVLSVQGRGDGPGLSRPCGLFWYEPTRMPYLSYRAGGVR